MTQLERFQHRLVTEIISALTDASDLSLNTELRARRRGEGMGMRMALKMLKEKNVCQSCGWGRPKRRRRPKKA